jgi:hypothetical protein
MKTGYRLKALGSRQSRMRDSLPLFLPTAYSLAPTALGGAPWLAV